jgi:hypothetical protein
MNGCINWKQGLTAGALAASILAGAPMAGAATQDGTVGPTSTGTVDVQILVPNLVLVENLDSITLNYAPGGGDVSVAEPFCVWATPGTLYDITISSLTNTGTVDFVATGAASNVNYNVEFDDNVAGISWEDVTENATLNNGGSFYTPANNASPGCSTDNSALRVTAVESGNLDAAADGVYGDTLTLLVSPN